MATDKQIEANRRNALQSTGPKTPEGKAASSMNNLRHGLRAATVVLPNENNDAFVQLCDDLESQWQPHGPTERFYLEQMAASQWKLARTERREWSIDRELRGVVNIAMPMLDKLSQIVVRLERSYSRAQRELEKLQQARLQASQSEKPAPAPQPTNPEPKPAPAQQPPAYVMANAGPANPLTSGRTAAHQPALQVLGELLQDAIF